MPPLRARCPCGPRRLDAHQISKVKPSTLSRYQKVAAPFCAFLYAEHMYPSCAAEWDDCISEYLAASHISKSDFSNLIASTEFFFPRFKGKLKLSKAIASGWSVRILRVGFLVGMFRSLLSILAHDERVFPFRYEQYRRFYLRLLSRRWLAARETFASAAMPSQGPALSAVDRHLAIRGWSPALSYPRARDWSKRRRSPGRDDEPPPKRIWTVKRHRGCHECGWWQHSPLDHWWDDCWSCIICRRRTCAWCVVMWSAQDDWVLCHCCTLQQEICCASPDTYSE